MLFVYLEQIENEYGTLEKFGGAAEKNYLTWAAQMAVDLNTGVPWVMCKQDDAPDPVVIPHRPVEDMAFAVARFIAKGACIQIENIGNRFWTWNAGVLGPVTLEGLNEGKRDLSAQKWIYQIGLRGESLSINTLSGSSSVEWEGASTKQPLTIFIIFQAFFNAPAGNEPLALDMSSMGKGQIWINGQSIGRYWPAYKANGSCDWCDYRGTYHEKKCQSNCGEPSQKW
ncbi:hypothetical protein BHE74_00033566 [Ensete ventricosum]|nr:hypothetical protein BHE74_00033566 [Ensete ventricosum]